MKKYNLSNSEEILMNTLWKENAPLTVAQLSEKITEADWKPNYVDKLVKQLVKKGPEDFFDKLGRLCSRTVSPGCRKTCPAGGFGGKKSVKGNRQGFLSRSITRRSGRIAKLCYKNYILQF